MSADEKGKIEEMTAKKFIANYQIAFNNYSNGIKYYLKYKQIIDEYDKIVTGYKDIIKEFKKRLSQLIINLKKAYFIDEKKDYKYDNNIFTNLNHNFDILNNILQCQIDLYTIELSDLENNNCYRINDKKNDTMFLNTLNQNRKIFENEKKIMEKLIYDYDNEYEKLFNEYDETEEYLKNFYLNQIDENKKNKNDPAKFNEVLDKNVNDEKKFLEFHNNFSKQNDYYFMLYDNYIKGLEKELSKNSNDLNKNVNLFFSLKSKYNSTFQYLNDSNQSMNMEVNAKNKNDKEISGEKKSANNEKESQEENKNIENKNANNEKETPGENKSVNNEKEILGENITNKENLEKINEKEKIIKQDFTKYKEKYFSSFEKKYIKEKYIIKAVEETIIDDKLGRETKKTMNNLNEALNLDDCFEEGVIILPDEVVYEIAKNFYAFFEFVDKSKYNLTVEQKKIEVKNLSQRLLLFGYKKKKYKEYQHLVELGDNDVTTLLGTFKSKEYRLSFLRVLNNFRALGFLELPKREYDIVSNYFKVILDYVEKERDIQSLRLILILSQTFYITINGEKHYLQKDLYGHKFFQDKDFWDSYLKDIIQEELNKIKKHKKMDNIEEKKKSNREIGFGKIFPFGDNMIGFGMSKEVLMEILTPLFTEFDFTEEMKKNIEDIIDSKLATTK